MRTTWLVVVAGLALWPVPGRGSAATQPTTQTHTARGHIEIRAAAPGIVAPTEPKLTFALIPWIEFPRPNPPEEVRGDPARLAEWNKAWPRSEAARQTWEAHTRAEANAPRYPFELAPDGSFEIEGLPAGDYKVVSNALEPPLKGRAQISWRKVTVPATRPARGPAAMIRWLWAEGDPAPDVTLQFFDGQTRRLSDYRGKTVVLHFWGTWCAPCVDGLPGWQKLHDELGEDPNKVILHVNHGDSIERASRFLADRGYAWPQVTDAWSNDVGQVTTPLGVEGFPSIAIIDPDGRLDYVGIGSVEMARFNLFPTPTTGPASSAGGDARSTAKPRE